MVVEVVSVVAADVAVGVVPAVVGVLAVVVVVAVVAGDDGGVLTGARVVEAGGDCAGAAVVLGGGVGLVGDGAVLVGVGVVVVPVLVVVAFVAIGVVGNPLSLSWVSTCLLDGRPPATRRPPAFPGRRAPATDSAASDRPSSFASSAAVGWDFSVTTSWSAIAVVVHAGQS